MNFFCLFSVLLCFSFFRLLFSFCSIWKCSIVFLMLPSSLVHPCFLLFLAFLCSFLDMKSNETNNTSQCQHGFKCVQLFKIPYFFVTVRFHWRRQQNCPSYDFCWQMWNARKVDVEMDTAYRVLLFVWMTSTPYNYGTFKTLTFKGCILWMHRWNT